MPNSPATRASTDSSPEIKRYLGIARQAFPQRADTALIEDAQAICAKLAATSSAHDAVGELAAKLGNQTSAKQLVDAATAAYCP